jgi:hypothetical protein
MKFLMAREVPLAEKELTRWFRVAGPLLLRFFRMQKGY